MRSIIFWIFEDTSKNLLKSGLISLRFFKDAAKKLIYDNSQKIQTAIAIETRLKGLWSISADRNEKSSGLKCP